MRGEETKKKCSPVSERSLQSPGEGKWFSITPQHAIFHTIFFAIAVSALL